MGSKEAGGRYDPLAGYFGSVVLGLIASSWLARFIVDMVQGHLDLADPDRLLASVGAAFFLGTVLSNPVGVAMNRTPVVRHLARFLIGAVIGFGLQEFVFTPFAGDGVAHFLFILLAVAVVPVILMVERFRNFLDTRGLVASGKAADLVLRVLNWPPRALFVLMMAMSFVLLNLYAPEWHIVALVAVVAVVFLTGVVIFQHTEEPEEEDDPFDQWLNEEPEDVPVEDQAAHGLSSVLLTRLPGAVIFSAITQLSVDVVLWIHPEFSIGLASFTTNLPEAGKIMVSGLGLILAGMMVSVGIGLTVLAVIGKIRSWDPVYMRDTCLRFIHMMSFHRIQNS
ncbi:MAG: hypothetical protein OEZ19_10685 [Paracoccaceae bacterium]|nr:hypothetical protein [Paracoccaceae bacterium]